MRKLATISAIILSTSLFAGCVAERHGRYRRDHRETAWDVVQSDPCRQREYDDYARDHQNPEKRRLFVEHLARDGCDKRYQRDYRYDDPNYDPYR